jgi:hypothetical protein
MYLKFSNNMQQNTILLLVILTGLSAVQCTKKMQPIHSAKIEFEFSSLDESGLRNGEVAVDYEFCIPASDEQLKEVIAIDPNVRVMKSSKGRIGCSKQQWLCINSTHSPGWKDKLFAIASLSYVERIQQTFYE